jgi:hypothetical protein
LVTAAEAFLESWLVRRDYDGAFKYLSPKSYECYNLERGENQPAATSLEDAGQKLRASLEASGKMFGTATSLDSILTAVHPVHPATRVMNHRDGRTFTLTSIPNVLGDVAECAARAAGSITVPEPMPFEYGRAFGMAVRFRTRSGDAPVLRLLWRREDAGWRITSYAVEMP